MNYADHDYWVNVAGSTEFDIAAPNDQIRKFIERWILTGEGKTALEIGCVPGRYLACLGELGYELNGIDIVDEGVHQTKRWLLRKGYRIRDIECIPFEKFDPERQFDLVCSFGFIEHYEDFIGAILRHVNWVSPGGSIVITTPNFRGMLQNKLHQWLDTENLKRHNIKSMRPEIWSKYMIERGFEILFAGYFGYFTFWVEENDARTSFQRSIVSGIKNTLPFTSRLLPKNSKVVSPFCGVIAKRVI
jgi:2-polyprenyl-3-methyl-5-hydroxy-6-metoxy-1,4-benzoquinol methylase